MIPRHTAALLVLLAAGCASQRPFVWVENFEDASTGQPQVLRLAPRDVIAVRVWNQEALSADGLKIREDGRISMMFLGDVEAAGATPQELAAKMERDLLPFIVKPVVTVVVQQQAPVSISLLGKVLRPAQYELPRGSGLLELLAAGGGLTDFADDEAIFVLRRDAKGDHQRIRFRWDDLTGGPGKASSFMLRTGDVVVVE